MDETPEDTMVVYTDYVCPFCYLGEKSLGTYRERAGDPPVIERRPFDLRMHKRRQDRSIDHGVEDGKGEAYDRRAKQNVDRLAEAYGVEMRWDMDRDVDSWDAHQVAVLVQRRAPEQLEAWHVAVFEALWKQGRDIGDPAVLRELAGEAGLDPGLVDQALEDDELAEELRDRFLQAHRAGVTGVPTFCYGDLAVPGAIPPEHLGKLVQNG